MAASVKCTPNGGTATMDTQKMSLYELSREQRIRENRERLQKLGITDLSLNLKLKPHTSQPRNRLHSSNSKTSPPLSAHTLSAPLRRSSRLQNVEAVSYCEAHPCKDEALENGKEEIYSEEEEKLLGNTEKEWTLFVDGYGKDGKRIYDSINGKTCHQCRQKTLGYRTQCSQCNMVQGQFCGDCLYMRYGEHVLEALQNPNWICPPCRGICNCSLCRQAKGWAPTGYLYRKVAAMGYKSVAHYLIQTRRAGANVEENADASVPVSAEKSLPLLESGGGSNESIEVNENNCIASLKPQSEDGAGQVSAKRSLVFSDVQDQHDNDICLSAVNHQSRNDKGQVSAKRSLPFSDVKVQHDKDEQCMDAMKHQSGNDKGHVSAKRGSLPFSDMQGRDKKVAFLEVKDCVARRLRPRVQKS